MYTTAAGIFHPFNKLLKAHCFLLSLFRLLRVTLIKRYCPVPGVSNEAELVVSCPVFSRHTSPDLDGVAMNAETGSSVAKRTYLRFENPARQRAGLDRRILAESAPDARCPRFRHCDKNTFMSVRDHVRPQHLKNGRRGRGLIDSGALMRPATAKHTSDKAAPTEGLRPRALPPARLNSRREETNLMGGGGGEFFANGINLRKSSKFEKSQVALYINA